MQPERSEAQRADGNWDITVTPPSFLGFKPSVVTLTKEQHDRYVMWRRAGGLIQDFLGDLDRDTREQLMSGISPEDWDRAFGSPE